MRLIDVGLRCRRTKLNHPNHQSPPWLIEDARRDRSNRLLGSKLPTRLENPPLQQYRDNSWHTKYQQKDRKLLVQGVPRLSDTHPKIDPRDPQPKRDEYHCCRKSCGRIVAGEELSQHHGRAQKQEPYEDKYKRTHAWAPNDEVE